MFQGDIDFSPEFEEKTEKKKKQGVRVVSMGDCLTIMNILTFLPLITIFSTLLMITCY